MAANCEMIQADDFAGRLLKDGSTTVFIDFKEAEGAVTFYARSEEGGFYAYTVNAPNAAEAVKALPDSIKKLLVDDSVGKVLFKSKPFLRY